MKEKDLLNLKDKVDNAKANEQQLKGQQKEIINQLKDDFDSKTIDTAKKKRKQLYNYNLCRNK